jgi:PEP-CTERM motif
MKLLRVAFFVAVLLSLARNVSGQSFVNLNFERAIITPDPSSPYYPYAVYASSAIPGWTATGLLSPNEIVYNTLSLGATSVSLQGINSILPPLAGAYSIDLYGGSEGPAAGASISQTGLVPLNTDSIRFIAQGPPPGIWGAAYGAGPLLVSLGGQNIPIYAISTGPNYTTYGGDVSAFAGEAEPLTFTAPPGNNNYWEIDNIQFSITPIPEPSTLSLFGIGILFLCWRMKPNATPVSN